MGYLQGSKYEKHVHLAGSGKRTRESNQVRMSGGCMTVVAANTSAQLQDFLYPLSMQQQTGKQLVWLLTTDESDSYQGTGRTGYEQALRVARNQLTSEEESNGFTWPRLMSSEHDGQQFRVVPPYEMYCSATLLPSLLQLEAMGAELQSADIYVMNGGVHYMGTGDCAVLQMDGQDTFLTEAECGFKPWIHYLETGVLNSKVSALIQQHVLDVHKGMGVFIVTPRTEGAGGSFRIAEKLRDQFAASELSVIALSAGVVKINYWDRSEVEGGQHKERNRLKRLKSEEVDRSQISVWLKEIQQHIGDRPLILLGWENIMRGFSPRVDCERCITALMLGLGYDQTLEALLQASGRATGNLRDVLWHVHHIHSVTVLMEEVDWTAVQRYNTFQRELFRRLEAGVGLSLALTQPFKAEECGGHCDFLICRIPRQKKKTTVRRISRQDLPYQPDCPGDDPEAFHWSRTRRHNVAAQHLHEGALSLNINIPSLECQDADAAGFYEPSRVCLVDAAAMQAAADDPNALVLTQVYTISPTELGFGDMEEAELLNFCRTRSNVKMQRAVREHLGLEPTSASVVGIEARRSRLLRKNPLLWSHTHLVDHYHGVFWRACRNQDGEVEFVLVRLLFTPEQLQQHQAAGTSAIWHGVESANGSTLPGITVSDYSERLSIEIRYQPAVEVREAIPPTQDNARTVQRHRVLFPYIEAGFMEPGVGVMSCRWRDHHVVADLLDDGCIAYNTVSFTTPSSFAVAVKRAGGGNANSRSGWDCVFYDGVVLEAIRARAQAT